MIYAPVIIPTLNRYSHLKACVDSLAANKQAPYTELYISLDFPPSPKYEPGYRQIKSYLEGGIRGFKRVYIFFQHENLGPGGNISFLFRKVKESCDRYIVTEDDNIFSMNFLEYMNWALDKYADNQDIISISGYSQMVCWQHEKSPIQLLSNEYNTWGSGTWVYKQDNLASVLESSYMCKAVRKPYFFIKLLTNRPDLIPEWFRFIRGKDTVVSKNGKLLRCDITLTMYILLKNKYTIMPTITKVNNEGWDGSGVNCYAYNFDQPKLDSSFDWIPSDEDIVFDVKSNVQTLKKYFLNAKIARLKNRVFHKP